MLFREITKMKRTVISVIAGLVLVANTAISQPSESISVSARDIPVAYQTDVLVIGGTGGGVAAAVAAARQGAKVLLIANRTYLGDDICGTYRLWLEDGEQPALPLAREVYNSPSSARGNNVAFTYVSDLPSDARHSDTEPPSKLLSEIADPKAAVQYNADVTLTLDMGKPCRISGITATVFSQPRQYGVKDIAVLSSDDGKQWTAQGSIQNDPLPESKGQSIPLHLQLNETARYLKLQFYKPEGIKRILLGHIAVQAAESTDCSFVTPMHIKRTLEQALLKANVEFLFSCYPSEVLFDEQQKPAGLIMANRNGRQAILTKTIIDATPRAVVARMAGVPFKPYPAGKQVFRRVVVGGPPVSSPSVQSARKIPAPVCKLANGDVLQAVEYTLNLEMPDASWASFAVAEQAARDATWTPQQMESSEALFQVPPDPMTARKPTTNNWTGSAGADIDAFRPVSPGGLYVLGGCADLPREAAEKLLRPATLMEMGDRIGQAAAIEAAAGPQSTQVHLLTSNNKATLPGDLKELLIGMRPTQTGLPTLHIPSRTLPVLGSYDVVVVGGGTGGAPAGIAAARGGAKTLVIESLYGMGGIATLGEIGIYWHGTQTGFTEEVDNGLKAWGQKYGIPGGGKDGRAWNADWKMEWYRRELEKAGGDFWPRSLGCGAVVDNGKVKGVAVATPGGWGIVLAKTVVDSTGSSDIAIAAGAGYVFIGADSPAIQGVGLPYRTLQAPPKKSRFYINTDYTFVDDTDMLDTWRIFLLARDKFKDQYDLGQLIQSRERRRIVGDFTVMPTDAFNDRTYDDTICQAHSSFDLHGFTVHPMFMFNAQNKEIKETYLPYRALLPKGLDGILVTGVGISAHRDVMAVLRMIADIQNHGYAAGTAAAMATSTDCSLRQIDIKTLQRHLVEKGCLSAEVLTQKDNFDVPPERLAKAVANVQNDYDDLAMLLAHWEQTQPLLQKAFASDIGSDDRLIIAHVLGIMGNATGADVLLKTVQTTPWDKGWNFRGTGQFGSSMSKLDSYIVALGRTKDQRAVEPLTEKVRQLGPDREFSHFQAAAMALEVLGNPAAAKPLADLLSQPGMTGYAVTMETARKPEPEYDSNRAESMRELIMARALYRCGDFEGVGYRILKQYEADLRGPYSRHAHAILQGKNLIPSGQ